MLAWPSMSSVRSLARLARLGFDAVVADFLELLVEELFLASPLGLQAVHAVEFLFAKLPGLLGDAHVSTQDDVAEPVAHEPEVALGDVGHVIARLADEPVELLLKPRHVGTLGF